MADVFISYAREDAPYVQRLQRALQARGKDVWVDVEGVRDGEVFPAALRRAIEGSDAFVFVISPDSVRSQFCELEVEHAVALNKRVVPLALRSVPDEEIPEEIRFRSWIPVGDGSFGPGLDRLVAALEADLEWERQHTRLTVRAMEWDHAGRDRNFLLRGSELAGAERWLAAGADKDPGPSGLEQEYLLAARAGAARRQRMLVGGSAAIAVVAIGLLVFALISRGQAVSAQSVSRSRALAAESTTELQSDPEVSILLAMAAARASPTPQSLAALRDAIDASPLRGQLPPRGPQACANAPGVAYSPSGRVVAESACDGRVLLVDATSGRTRARWNVGHPAGPVAFSPDGHQLAVATQAGVDLLDAATGKVLKTLATQSKSAEFAAALHCGSGPLGMPDELAFNRDGTRLTASYDWNLDIWTLGRGSYPRVVGGQNSCLKGAAFRASGNSIIAGDGRTVEVIDARSGRVRRTRPVLSVSGAPDPARPAVSVVTISPDGRLAAVAGVLNRLNASTVALWNTSTWTRVNVLVARADTPIDTLRFSPDGKRLAIGAGDGTVGIWSVSRARRLMSFSGHVASISSIAFRPDGRVLATASTDGDGRVWGTDSGEGIMIPTDAGPYLTKAIVSGDRVRAGIMLPQRSELPSWTIGGVPAGGFSTLAPPYDYRAVAFSGDGKTAVTQNYAGDFPVYNFARRRTIAKVAGETASVFAFQLVSGLALDTTGSRLAVASREGIQLYGLAHGPTAMAAGNLRACGANDQAYVAFSADDRRFVAVNECGEGIVWNAHSGQQLRTFDTGVSSVSAISLSPDGRLLALASPDRTVTVRNLNENHTAYVLRGDTAPMNDVAFSPTRSWIATASQDGDVRIWSAGNGQLLRILPNSSDVTSVSFSSDGTRIVTTDSKGIIRIEDACSLCGNAKELLRLGASRVSQQLTPAERRIFGG
jgi:WD40 repeat protein